MAIRQSGMAVAGLLPARRSRLAALVLAVGLGCSAPNSSHALLTELFVGGTVAMQVLGIVGEALPQVATLASSLAALVTSGKDVAGTVGRILDIFRPKGRKKGRQPATDERPRRDPGDPVKAGAGAEASPRFELPDLAAPVAADSDELTRELAGSGLTGVEEGESLTQLLRLHRRREAVVEALRVATAEQRPTLELGLLELTKSFEEAVDVLIQELREAARRDDRRAVARFRQAVKDLGKEDRLAVQPVLEQLLGRGEQFRSLYGSPDATDQVEARALAPLRSLLLRQVRGRRR